MISFLLPTVENRLLQNVFMQNIPNLECIDIEHFYCRKSLMVERINAEHVQL